MHRGVLVVALVSHALVAHAQVAGATGAPAPATSALLPGDAVELASTTPSAAVSNHDAFTGSPGLAASVIGVVSIDGDGDGALVRACGTVRLGPIVLCAGAIAGGSGAQANVHADVLSYQRNGWELALGYGWHDGGTVGAAIPLDWIAPALAITRLRALYTVAGAQRLGLGLEVDL